ncbi:hypothetical protein I553_8889 [Mycobacterium xenopi 4042]|uniref:Uncharacterized protein n=1 Tax=Mycobacterium xenopi 4042 TaxID=1299334 RepID=X8CNL8_MYCXE|nr:hypothetical protein I552_8538 [Mycobacterium xenopi 3993]EUA56835.1 hypothetical protein I553_8889 [Mycobacterium xenopi 4042]
MLAAVLPPRGTVGEAKTEYRRPAQYEGQLGRSWVMLPHG